MGLGAVTSVLLKRSGILEPRFMNLEFQLAGQKIETAIRCFYTCHSSLSFLLTNTIDHNSNASHIHFDFLKRRFKLFPPNVALTAKCIHTITQSSLLPMSTAADGRRRPNLWSYISFGQNPRRRSISLPTRSLNDPWEKADRHSNNHDDRDRGFFENLSDAWMNQSSRGRYVKVGGLIGILVFLFILFSPAERTRVTDLVGGKHSTYKPETQ